jgi:phosphoribosylanthranilate isomerase
MSLAVKICGLSTRETLDAALDAGADMVGFVFFPPSPRHLALDEARELGQQVKRRALKAALTVNADDATLAGIVEVLQPDIFQLHGHETPARVSEIKRKFGRDVMKALPVESRADLAALSSYAAVCDRILFDACPPKDATRPGGLGAVFDWRVLEALDLKLPFMVSGGLHAGNVADAVRITRAGGLDVSSGVERAPGIKDVDMIRDFIRAARATGLSSPLPVYGERSNRVSDPGEGESTRTSLSSISQKEPLTPTLSPQERGEGVERVRQGGKKS